MVDKNYRAVAATIDIVFWQTGNSESDYIKIVRFGNDDIEFTKGNYEKISNAVPGAAERMDLIADFIKNKVNSPLQGMLFE
jgi:hypothetical protein